MEKPPPVAVESGTLKLNEENVAKLTGEAKLYEAAPYLLPIKLPAARFHAQIPKKGCSSCVKKKLKAAFNQVCRAFVSLLESHQKKGGSFEGLKKYIGALTSQEVRVLEIMYEENKTVKRFVC